MLEVHESQTAKFLKNRILDILKKYHLSVEQLFSITTDNGANMLAAAKKLQQEYALQVHADHETVNEGEADQTREEHFTESLTTELNDHLNIIRCAIHTLQLALNDVVGNNDDTMRVVTNIAKSTKKVKYNQFFDYNKGKRPPLWSPTRWNGKYKLVKSFVNQEQFFVALGEQYPELGKT